MRGPRHSTAVMAAPACSAAAVSASWPSAILQRCSEPSLQPLSAMLPLVVRHVTRAARKGAAHARSVRVSEIVPYR
jgi:hypothetical protein